MLEDSTFDSDFEEAVEKINAKLAEAGKLMAEAREIGKKAGFESLSPINYCGSLSDEMYDALNEIDFHPILNEMDELGWRTSSLHC